MTNQLVYKHFLSQIYQQNSIVHLMIYKFNETCDLHQVIIDNFWQYVKDYEEIYSIM